MPPLYRQGGVDLRCRHKLGRTPCRRSGLGPLAGDPAGGRPNLAGRRKLEPSRPDPLRGNNTEIGIERLFEERSSRRGRGREARPATRPVRERAACPERRGDDQHGPGGVAPTNVRGGPIERDLDTVDADDEVVESLKPEVLRSMGYSAWEPEPDEPATAGESVTAT
jgi:hypothetical protein